MKHPLAGQIRFFFSWRLRGWGLGLYGPVPAMPYSWRFAIGPFWWVRVTTESATKMTRQRRRALKQQIAKAYRRQANRHHTIPGVNR